MAQLADTKGRSKVLGLATFYVGEAFCGMDILQVQEINKQMEATRVPQAPEYVLGVLNLRGRIVTVIDLGRKLGLSPSVLGHGSRNIIVDSQNEHIDTSWLTVLRTWSRPTGNRLNHPRQILAAFREDISKGYSRPRIA